MDPREREQRILEHYPVVRAIAGGVFHRIGGRVPLDELVSTGMIGLIDAVDRFDPERGVPLKAYVEMRVRSSIIESLRAADWVPRSVRRTSAQLASNRVELQQRLGREPTREEEAAQLGVSVDRLRAMGTRSEVRSLVSLDAPVGEEGESRVGDLVASDDGTVLDHWIDAEDRGRLAEAIAALPERPRRVVELYYQAGRSLKEIGAELGVTEGRVSQLRSEAVRLLQLRLHDTRAEEADP